MEFIKEGYTRLERSTQIVQEEKESVESPTHQTEELETKEALLFKRVLLKPLKESREPEKEEPYSRQSARQKVSVANWLLRMIVWII